MATPTTVESLFQDLEASTTSLTLDGSFSLSFVMYFRKDLLEKLEAIDLHPTVNVLYDEDVDRARFKLEFDPREKCRVIPEKRDRQRFVECFSSFILRYE